jgi:hypothetical protein
MTDSQFIEIQDYVTKRLASQQSFLLHPNHFCKMFRLTPPFYRDLVQRVKAAGIPFVTEGQYMDTSGDPSDPIRFSRAIE